MGIKAGISKFILPVLAVVLGVSAFLIITGGQKEKKQVVPVTLPSTSGSLGKTREGLVAGAGVVEPSSELVGIGATVSGVIKEVLVKTNDVVQKNDPLFLIDDREAAADVASKSAGVAVAKSNIESAVLEEKERASSLSLYKSIGDKRAMSEDELTRRSFAAQSALAKLQAARALLSQAEALLSQARTAQGLRIVRAPFTGTILQVKIRAGEFAPATQLSEPLLTMGQIDPLYIRVDIDEADVNRVKLSSAAEVSPRGSPELRTTAAFVRAEPLVVPKKSLTNSSNERVDTRVQQLVFALPQGTQGFYVGQQVDAYIPAKEVVSK